MTSSLPLPSTADDQSFERLVAAARDGGPWPPEEVARLALHLADSGERLIWPAQPEIVDVASTGGPGSLSTLLAPLALRTFGCHVVKLAVPGRPAGAIDALATVRGYRVQLSSNDVRETLARCGFAHFLADARFAPLDAALFSYRKRFGAVSVPTLAAASLLSKKIAVGVTRIGLDIRVGPHGNFGASPAEARTNGALFCAAARILGIDAVAMLGTGMPIAQPWIGRGESLVALTTCLETGATADTADWLAAHASRCSEMAAVASGKRDGVVDGEATHRNEMCDALGAHLAAQGTSLTVLRERVESVSSADRVPIEATEDGVVAIDLGLIRDVIVELQEQTDSPGSFGDPCGLRLMAKPGTHVQRGEHLALIRCESADVDRIMLRFRSAFRIGVATSTSVLTAEPALEVIRA